MEVDGLKEMKLQPLHYSMIYLENFPSLIIQNLKNGYCSISIVHCYDISFRTADHIIGEWSKPQKLVDGWQYSQLYGSYIHPISLKGNILYFIMSMWLPYNTYLMSAELKCNP